MRPLARTLLSIALATAVVLTPVVTEPASADPNPQACGRKTRVEQKVCEFVYQPGLLFARIHVARVPSVTGPSVGGLGVGYCLGGRPPFCVGVGPYPGDRPGLNVTPGFPSIQQGPSVRTGPGPKIEVRRASGEVVLSCYGPNGCATAKNEVGLVPGETLQCVGTPRGPFVTQTYFRCASGST